MLTFRMFFAGLAVAGVVAGGATACSKAGKSAKTDGKVVATVDDEQIFMSDLQDELDKLPPYLKGRVGTPEGRREFLDNLLTRRALMHEAAARGIEDDPAIKKQITEYKERLILQKLMHENIEQEPQVGDEEIRKYFDEHPDEFKESEQVRVRHVLVKIEPGASDSDKAAAKKKAEGVLRSAKKGEDFEKLARENSQDPGSASRGGDLGFFPRGRMAKAFEDTAFALDKPGQLSDVVETQFGYHVIQYVDRQTSKEKGFEEAKEQIRRRLAPQKQRESYQGFIENVKKNHKIVVHDDVLGTMAETNAPAQASMPAPETK